MKKGLILIVVLLCFSCSDDDSGYQPTPSPLEIPEIFSTNIIPPVIPSGNPQTVEGIALGKKLFFDRNACEPSLQKKGNVFTNPTRFP